MRDWIFLHGSLAVLMGIIVPFTSLTSIGLLSVAFGFYLVTDSFFVFYAGRPREESREADIQPLKIQGVLAGLVGLLALILPIITETPASAVVWVIGGWFAVAGCLTLVTAKRDRHRLRRPAAFISAGVVSLAAGLFVLFWPLGRAAMTATVSGYLLVVGALMLASSGGLRRGTIAPRAPQY